MRREQGFTLLETLIAILIFTILIVPTIYLTAQVLKVAGDTQETIAPLVQQSTRASVFVPELSSAHVPLWQAYNNQLEWSVDKNYTRYHYVLWRESCSATNPRVFLAKRAVRYNLNKYPSAPNAFSNTSTKAVPGWTVPPTGQPGGAGTIRYIAQTSAYPAPSGSGFVTRLTHNSGALLEARSDLIPIIAGRKMMVGGYYKPGSSSATNIRMRVEFLDTTGSVVGTPQYTQSIGGPGNAITSWSYYSLITSEAPVSAKNLRVVVEAGSVSSSTVDFDGIFVSEDITNRTPFFANTPAGSWLGMEYHSMSVEPGYAQTFPGVWNTPYDTSLIPASEIRTLGRVDDCDDNFITYEDKAGAILPLTNNTTYEARLRNTRFIKLYWPNSLNTRNGGEGYYQYQINNNASNNTSPLINPIVNGGLDIPLVSSLPPGWTNSGAVGTPSQISVCNTTLALEPVDRCIHHRITHTASTLGGTTTVNRYLQQNINITNVNRPITFYYRYTGPVATNRYATCRVSLGTNALTTPVNFNNTTWQKGIIYPPATGIQVLSFGLVSVTTTALNTTARGCDFDAFTSETA